MRSDKGASLTEVVGAIVLLGILVPAIYAVSLTLERNMQRGHELLQTYQVVQRAVESTKFDPTNPEIIGDLPPGFSATITKLGPVKDVKNLDEFKVTVMQGEREVQTYNFYWYVPEI